VPHAHRTAPRGEGRRKERKEKAFWQGGHFGKGVGISVFKIGKRKEGKIGKSALPSKGRFIIFK